MPILVLALCCNGLTIQDSKLGTVQSKCTDLVDHYTISQIENDKCLARFLLADQGTVHWSKVFF